MYMTDHKLATLALQLGAAMLLADRRPPLGVPRPVEVEAAAAARVASTHTALESSTQPCHSYTLPIPASWHQQLLAF